MTLEIWQILAFASVVYAILWVAGRFLLPRLRFNDGPIEVREAELRTQIVDLERRLAERERKNEQLETNQNLLLGELRKSNAKMSQQDVRILELTGKVSDLQRVLPVVAAAPADSRFKAGRVLGIWPNPLVLDATAIRDTLFDTGLEYESLEGAAATRMGIVEQLGQRDDYRIMEIGAKGNSAGIQLHDSVAAPRWWSELAKQHNIDIFVVLSNESSKPGVVNVADALWKAGAKAVISVDSSIDDLDAVRFARMFYRRISEGVSLARAVDHARLVITDAGAETIKLRER